MTRQELIRDMKQTTKSSFITATQLAKYLGQQNISRVQKRYCINLERVDKKYFIPDVATVLMERRTI